MATHADGLCDVVITCIDCARVLVATNVATVRFTRDLPDTNHKGCVGMYTVCRQCTTKNPIVTIDIDEQPIIEGGFKPCHTSEIWSMHLSYFMRSMLGGKSVCGWLGYDDVVWPEKTLRHTEFIKDACTIKTVMSVHIITANNGKIVTVTRSTASPSTFI
jgi:hypothetical protein